MSAGLHTPARDTLMVRLRRFAIWLLDAFGPSNQTQDSQLSLPRGRVLLKIDDGLITEMLQRLFDNAGGETYAEMASVLSLSL